MNLRKAETRKANLSGREVGYTVTVSQKASKARIRVGPGGVVVIVPRSAPRDRATEFLTENAAWVLTELARVERMGSIRRPAAAPTPGTILFRGECLPVRLVTDDTRRRFALVRRGEGGLTVSVPRHGRVDVAAALERWLRREARSAVEARIAVWGKALKRTPNRVYIRGQRTKWGNCSKLGNLSLNWRLVMAPEATLDAIVIHELAHLIEPTHATRFWLLVRSHCPDYHTRVKWLAEREKAMFTSLNASISLST